jgi:hypothetical protein
MVRVEVGGMQPPEPAAILPIPDAMGNRLLQLAPEILNDRESPHKIKIGSAPEEPGRSWLFRAEVFPGWNHQKANFPGGNSVLLTNGRATAFSTIFHGFINLG